MTSIKQRGYRWFDSSEPLARSIGLLKHLHKRRRDRVFDDIRKVIEDWSPGIFDKEVSGLTFKRRWYDKDPYAWLVINVMEKVPEDLYPKIIEIIDQECGSH